MGASDENPAEAILRRSAWLEGRHELVAPILAHGRVVRLLPGQWAQAEGDDEAGVLVVLSGTLELYCKAPGDREVRIGQAGPGVALGQTVRFGGGPRLLTAICRDAATVLQVSDRALSRIAQDAPRIWEAVAALLYLQLRNLLHMVAQLTALPPRARLAARLGLLAAGAQGRPLGVSQEALGEMVGLTRKTVNAHLGAFERDGLIRRRYGGVEILDARGLRRVAEAPATDAS
ncbi:MAG: Crp/Fnr family transcriptional regulator [Caulobacterales bacterium]|nr:Crp/Fnr family transcriptional regulator [Caulobacterales bacterium]